ncbi:hypothetical protein ES707_16000 [subsurface metagenome]
MDLTFPLKYQIINLYSLISLMILPRAYPDEVRIGPGENKYDRTYRYGLYQNQERLPFLILILTLKNTWPGSGS